MIARTIQQLARTPMLRARFSTSKVTLEAFQTLLNKGDAASLKEVNTILANLQKESNSLSTKLQDIKNEINLIKSTEENLKHKLELLKGNVKEQEQENKLVEKRIQKEVANAEKYSVTKIAKELLDVADNMKRCAIESKKINNGKEDEFSLKLKDAHQTLVESFNKFGLKQFDPTGEPYNPNTSESMVEVPDPTKENGTVAMTTQTGFMLKDRVIRSAKVCVYRN